MKFKKVLLSIGVVIALVSSGCSKQKKQADPVLTKTQVIQKSQKSFKSGEAKQIVNLKTDTSSQIVASNYSFGGDPTVFHVNYQTEAKGKTHNMDEWISNTGNLYINGQSTWYKTEIEKMSGHSYADVLDAVLNNEMLMNPPKGLTDAYKMKRSGKTYTLTAKITDKKIMKAAVAPIFTTNTQSPQQQKIYQKLAKVGKFEDMTVKLVVKGTKLSTFSYTVNLKIGKMMKMSAGQSYSNLGRHDFLKVPNNALDGKPLPKENKKK